tara:strand:- start:761 stop:1333 length:573 start_codon:yes stop_codon:yes gene_type:complete
MALGRLMAKKHTIKVGGTTIEVNDLMDRMVEQVREGANGEIVEAMEDMLRDLKKDAQDQWPIGRIRKATAGEPSMSSEQHKRVRAEINKKGGSRAGYFVTNPREHSINLFELETKVTTNGVEVSLGNTASWAWAVRFGRKGGSGGLGVKRGKKAWTSLVNRPGRESSKQVIADMEERLIELANKAARDKK